MPEAAERVPASIANTIAAELAITPKQVDAVTRLLEDGATVPFIARYRKEATSSLDEVAVAKIRDRQIELKALEQRRATIVASLRERGLLDASLHRRLVRAATRAALEDLYLPHRVKRKTRAGAANERGLSPLAEALRAQDGRAIDVRAFLDAERGVRTREEALAGARDILAEQIHEDADARQRLRGLFESKSVLISKVIKKKRDDAGKFRDYFEWSEPLRRVPSHRLLAVLRGKNEGFLTVTARPDEDVCIAALRRQFVRGQGMAGAQVALAVADAYKRLVMPSLQKETLEHARANAERKAIAVFATNLREVLMTAPLGHKVVLAIDPGFRSGCKLAALSEHGVLLEHTTIYPHESGARATAAGATIQRVCTRLSVAAIAVGNGTAGRETEAFLRALKLDVPILAVDESGASIYSASQVARDEFPDLDLTVRGAISIGRRLQDPLAELVKLDPKSIGVGQYQHDVCPRALAVSLADTVHSCVSAVGVDVNSASAQLLAHVAGLGERLAHAIVGWRAERGPFRDRAALKKVPRLGDRAFEQAAGFLRVSNPAHPLDASAVHPERYALVQQMANDCGCAVADLLGEGSLRQRIDPARYVTDAVGLPTLRDIIAELGKPGRDPRPTFEAFEFCDVHKIEDLSPGMVLPGIVTNVTSFGAFVDVGVHNDGLVHVSQLADRYVRDPNEVVKVRQQVTVTVVEIDLARKRIALSMRSDVPNSTGPAVASTERRT